VAIVVPPDEGGGARVSIKSSKDTLIGCLSIILYFLKSANDQIDPSLLVSLTILLVKSLL
jgi:hypothetical protein